MALNVNVDDVIAKIRAEADIQTADEAASICTDAELTAWLNDAYRALFELVATETGQERFGRKATISPPQFALPNDFYRELGVDWAPDGTNLSGRPFPWSERNSLRFAFRPLYRLTQNKIIWEPEDQAPTIPITLWYINTPATLAAGGSFDSFLGWDTYVVLWVKLKVLQKQEYDITATAAELNAAEARVRRNAARVGGYPEVVGDVRAAADDWWYNG